MDIKEYISSGIIEMYVMGICTAEEKLELETLRGQYPDLNKAINKYEIELEEEMLRQPKLPSLSTDELILKQLESLQTPVLQIDSGKNKRKLFTWSKFAAAAVLLLMISSYFNFTLYNNNKKQDIALRDAVEKSKNITLPLADYNILKDPGITPVAMYGVGYHAICRCTMFWDKKTGKIYIMIHHLPQSSTSRDYQLWANVNGKQVSIGIIQDEIRGRFIEMQGVPADAASFIVTLENAGGAMIPTIEETYLSGKI